MGVRSAVCLLALLCGVACATKKPVLYPNAHYQRVGSEVAQTDIEDCMRLAEADVGNRNVAEEAAGGAAVGGGGGAAIGAAGGAVRGRAGTGAAVGAATGATAGFLRGLFRSRDPDPVFARFVTTCLRERGYQTIGWR